MTRRRQRRTATAIEPLVPRPPEVTPIGWAGLLLGIGVAAAAGLIYLLTAARDIVVGDSAEFVTAAITLGVVHPSGYPLPTLVGHVFTWLPVGSEPFRVNLVSVVCGALTVGVIFLIAKKLTGDLAAAALAALALAFHPLFWSWSLVAEAFSPNNFIAATLVYLVIMWESRPERSACW